jgi:hypothetical protein
LFCLNTRCGEAAPDVDRRGVQKSRRSAAARARQHRRRERRDGQQRRPAELPDIAAEIVRCVLDASGITLPDGSRRGPYVVRLSDPPTAHEHCS